MDRPGSQSGSQVDPAEHDRIDELMAGYALRSLTGEDATEADRLLSEHVPGCARCRETLLALNDTVADLAFAADPIAPPDTLLPRLHRELEPRGERAPVGRWVGVAANDRSSIFTNKPTGLAPWVFLFRRRYPAQR